LPDHPKYSDDQEIPKAVGDYGLIMSISSVLPIFAQLGSRSSPLSGHYVVSASIEVKQNSPKILAKLPVDKIRESQDVSLLSRDKFYIN
jgi:hypothetical protein